MNIKTAITFFILSLHITNVFSQRCLTSTKRQEAIQNNPHLADQLRLQEDATQRWIANNASILNNRDVVTIPVVVHILWRVNQENISDAQVMSQIEVLNKDFRKLNNDFSSGPAPFQTLGADIEIEFCLASVDPNGNTTTGITRRQTQVNNIGETDNWYKTNSGGQDAWDINKYLNIWVCDMGDDGTLGFATPPGTAVPPESDGAVIGHQYFGTTGTAANSQPNHLGRTTTHELGHYFNLEHVWGPDYGGCNEDDFVSDTPNQYESTYDCPNFPVFDNCTSSGNGIMFNNYMDYVNDNCMTMFTEGQKMRMLAALNGPRASLLTSNGCAPSTSVTEKHIDPISIFPNPAQDKLYISNPNDNGSSHLYSIYNALGEKVLEVNTAQSTEIDIASLKNGIYFLTSSVNTNSTLKFIVSK